MKPWQQFLRLLVGAFTLVSLAGCVVPCPHTTVRSDAISGRVIDAATGLPIGGAKVQPMKDRYTHARLGHPAELNPEPATPVAITDGAGEFKLKRTVNMHWTTVVLAPCYGSVHEGGDSFFLYLVTKEGYVPAAISVFDMKHVKDKYNAADIPLQPGNSTAPQRIRRPRTSAVK